MGVWSSQVVPRVIDLALRGDDVSRWRRRCLEGLAGVVVEPGFGSGLNVVHYPSAVTKVFAVDPAPVGRRLAAERIAASPVTIEHVGLSGEQLPLDTDGCDAGVLAFTLCTIPDHRAALAELRRVIRPHGALHFLEHGLAPDAAVQRWQHRITPLQRRLVDGCHLNRSIVDDIVAAGFEIDWCEERYAGRPKAASWFSVGRAISPG